MIEVAVKAPEVAPRADESENHVSDQRLLKSAIDGSKDAFAELCNRFETDVFNYCYRACGSRDDAADATQDAFLKLYLHLPKLNIDKVHNIRAYMMVTARNSMFDILRSRQNRAIAVDEIPEPKLGYGGGEAPQVSIDLDPERRALLSSSQRSVQDANSRLPDKYREVLALRDMEGMRNIEIAEVLGTNANHVAQMVFRARAALRDELLGDATKSITAQTPECERALPMLSLLETGEISEPDRKWLTGHLSDCKRCAAANEALQEVAASYRAWAPVAAAPLLFGEDAKAAAAMAQPGGMSGSFFASRKVQLVAASVAACGAGALLFLFAAAGSSEVAPTASQGAGGANPFAVAKAKVVHKKQAAKHAKKENAKKKAKASSSSSSASSKSEQTASSSNPSASSGSSPSSSSGGSSGGTGGGGGSTPSSGGGGSVPSSGGGGTTGSGGGTSGGTSGGSGGTSGGTGTPGDTSAGGTAPSGGGETPSGGGGPIG